MGLQAGESLLHYRIIEKIGEGGMGEVWRASDTTLDREVAIKLLPAMFASDPDRLARFEREARVLASLNHPHIASIHGLHEAGGQRFLAMELVPGRDLAEMLLGSPGLPAADAVAIAHQIAEALEYAHEQGVVHRDLKPANVKVSPAGEVRVLDFGLAKALDPTAQSGVDAMNSPTLTNRATQAGVILGTAAYMSPEQARGKPVDRRADNWAFGCVLFEMLSGRRLFDGETVTDVLAAVVTKEPDWSLLPASTPPSLRRLLERCLDKNPRTRLRDIGEARIVLEQPTAAEPEVVAPVQAPPPRRQAASLVAIAAAAVLVGLAAGRYLLAPAAPAAPAFEFDVGAPPDLNVVSGSFALSPDGSRMALVVRDSSGARELAVRDFAAADLRVLPGTTGAAYPFWSPTGQEIGFFAGNQLFRMALDGAAPRLVTPIQSPMGGAWGAGDEILIGTYQGPIMSTLASGGQEPEAVTKFDGTQDGHVWPAFLPDYKHFVFLADSASAEEHAIYLGSLDGTPPIRLKGSIRSQPVVDPSGRLLLGERGQLLAYPFDLATGKLGDESTLVATQIYPIGNRHELPASAAMGVVASQQGSPAANLVVLDEAGRVVRTIGEPARYGNAVVSPNGKRIAFEIFTDTDERFAMAEDLERGVRTPLSARGHLADGTAWAPDNDTVYFDSNAGGPWAIFRKAVTGGGEPESLGTPEGSIDTGLLDVSPDGQWVLCYGSTKDGKASLYLRSTAAGQEAWRQWTASSSMEEYGVFSPDSRWIAYTSDASGRVEAYIASLGDGPEVRRWQISSAGGVEPRFSPDGKKLYYRSPSFDWMVVDLTLAPGAVTAGTPTKLFSLPPIELGYMRNVMAIFPNGKEFLNVRSVAETSSMIRVKIGK